MFGTEIPASYLPSDPRDLIWDGIPLEVLLPPFPLSQTPLLTSSNTSFEEFEEFGDRAMGDGYARSVRRNGH